MPDVWESWLRQVERVGFAAKYQKALDERFDSVEDLGARYVRSGTASGGKAVDPKFFEEIGVAHADHRSRFTEFLIGGSTREVSRTAGRAAARPTATTFLGESCSSWLQSIGVSNRGPFAETLEANFDAVGQIIEAYVSEGHADVAAFCADMGVEDGPDRQKLDAWFRSNATGAGASPSSRSPTPAAISSTAPVPSRSAPASGPTKSAPAASVPKTANRKAMEQWLREVDPGGSLDSYAEDLDENYDGVDQIEELYVTVSGKGSSKGGGGSRRVLSEQLFEDLGVEDPKHRALFSAHFAGPTAAPPPSSPASAAPAAASAAKAPITGAAELSEMAAWLRKLDGSGGLDQYLTDLEENYDSVDQIEELYVTVSGGKKKLDAQLFADLGIDLAAHRTIFTSHFEGSSGATAAVAGGASMEPAGSLSLSAWLEQVDPSGGLNCYRKDVEDNYDDVDQIVDLYLQDAPSGGGKVLDGQFFEDLGVASAAHISLFKAWFEKNHGPPQVPPPAAPVALAGSKGGPATIAEWLREVDPSGSVEALVAEFEDNYDDVDQIRDLYHVEKNGAKVLDEQLFEDMGIKDSALKARFRSWFSANADG